MKSYLAGYLQRFIIFVVAYILDLMKITLLTVGKTDRDWVRQGLDIYVSRLKHYIPFSIVEIPELKNVSALTKEQIKSREGELILKNLRPTDDVILLDERGREYTSVELAKVIQDKISYEGKDIVYIIGGAYGFSEAVYKRANSKLSLSKMTFSHQMVRAIFTEQIYRAFTIMKGEPYHHE
jgi:23S rRNA (pseudouridine1915-N3)-methyltransferase